MPLSCTPVDCEDDASRENDEGGRRKGQLGTQALRRLPVHIDLPQSPRPLKGLIEEDVSTSKGAISQYDVPTMAMPPRRPSDALSINIDDTRGHSWQLNIVQLNMWAEPFLWPVRQSRICMHTGGHHPREDIERDYRNIGFCWILKSQG